MPMIHPFEPKVKDTLIASPGTMRASAVTEMRSDGQVTSDGPDARSAVMHPTPAPQGGGPTPKELRLDSKRTALSRVTEICTKAVAS